MRSMIFFLVWILACAGFLLSLFRFSSQPGPVGLIQNKWPVLSKIIPDQTLPTLILFLHPYCSCSKATRLMVFIKDRAKVHLVLSNLSARLTDLSKSEIWVAARSISGVSEILVDDADFESKIFGAETSGHTFLYGSEGNLVFSGGLTPGRAHMGDSIGRETIIEWLNQNGQLLVTSAVYGCTIRKAERPSGVKHGSSYER